MKGLNNGHEMSAVRSGESTIYESFVHICDSSGEPVAYTGHQLLFLCSTVRLTNESLHYAVYEELAERLPTDTGRKNEKGMGGR